jgi:hypothetical protein
LGVSQLFYSHEWFQTQRLLLDRQYTSLLDKSDSVEAEEGLISKATDKPVFSNVSGVSAASRLDLIFGWLKPMLG